MGMTTWQQTGTAYRQSDEPISFFSGAAVDEIPEITNIPPVTYIVKIVVSGGTDPTGTVTIAGTQDGAAKTENVTINGNDTYYSINYFDPATAPTITTSGLSDEDPKPNLIITPVDPMFMQAINGSEDFSVDWISETVYVRDSNGDTVRFDQWCITDTELSVGEEITYDGVTYTVQKVREVKLMDRTVDHYKAYV